MVDRPAAPRVASGSSRSARARRRRPRAARGRPRRPRAGSDRWTGTRPRRRTARLVGREQVDQLALEPVRVLELVHQHRAEAPALALADLGLVAEQVARGQLEVLEVERRLARLRRRVRVGEAAQQLLEQAAVARSELVEGGLLDRTRAPPRRTRTLSLAAARREVAQVEEPLGVRAAARGTRATRRRPRAPRPSASASSARHRAASRSSSIRASSLRPLATSSTSSRPAERSVS